MSLSRTTSSQTGKDESGGSGSTLTSGMTKKALFIGVVMSVLLNIWTIHAAYVTGSSYISLTHLPVAALFPFMLVLLVFNPLMKFFWPAWVLNRYELIVVFFLVFTASTIPPGPSVPTGFRPSPRLTTMQQRRTSGRSFSSSTCPHGSSFPTNTGPYPGFSRVYRKAVPLSLGCCATPGRYLSSGGSPFFSRSSSSAHRPWSCCASSGWNTKG